MRIASLMGWIADCFWYATIPMASRNQFLGLGLGSMDLSVGCKRLSLFPVSAHLGRYIADDHFGNHCVLVVAMFMGDPRTSGVHWSGKLCCEFTGCAFCLLSFCLFSDYRCREWKKPSHCVDFAFLESLDG